MTWGGGPGHIHPPGESRQRSLNYIPSNAAAGNGGHGKTNNALLAIQNDGKVPFSKNRSGGMTPLP